MIDLLGRCIDDALSLLKKHGIKYRVVETFAPKPLQNTDSVRVIRQKTADDTMELTVGYFKTKI